MLLYSCCVKPFTRTGSVQTLKLMDLIKKVVPNQITVFIQHLKIWTFL